MFKSPSARVFAFTVIIVLLVAIPLYALHYWYTSGTELVLSTPFTQIQYSPSLLDSIMGSNDTKLRIEIVDPKGNPIGFTITLSGPSTNGVIEVARGRGFGSITVGIGGYVAEVKRALRMLNSPPERSGLGLLALISTVVNENGELYATGDAITIPIIPGKATGRDVIVKHVFQPLFKYKINLTEGSSGSETTVNPLSPPRTIVDKCYGGEIYYCYEWRLKEIIYESSMGGDTVTITIDSMKVKVNYIPVAVTWLDQSTGSKTIQVINDIQVVLNKASNKYVTFDAGLGILEGNIVKYISPGEGYRIEIDPGKDREILYSVYCYIYSTLSSESSICNVLEAEGFWRGYPASKFNGGVMVSIGFLAYMWVAMYEYVLTDGYSVYVIRDKDVFTWLVPAFNDYRKIRGWWEVDDNPSDGYGRTERYISRLLREGKNITRVYDPSVVYGTIYRIYTETIYVNSQASKYFGASLPVGVIAIVALGALGVNIPLWLSLILPTLVVGVDGQMGYLSIEVAQVTNIYGYYYMIKDTYYIKEEARIKNTPIILFTPTTT